METQQTRLDMNGLCYVVSEPKTFQDGKELADLEEGYTIKFKATIKGFSEFNGVKQIDLLRPSKAEFIN